MRNRTVGPLAVLAVAARREQLEGWGNLVSTLSSSRLSHSTMRAPAMTVSVPLGQSRLIGPERTATRAFQDPSCQALSQHATGCYAQGAPPPLTPGVGRLVRLPS